MSTNNEDKLILGGHEFTSRFILGSGKFSLDLVKACIEKADAQIITRLCVVPMKVDWQIFWTIFRKMLLFFPILQVPEMQKKQFVLPDFPEKSDAVIS